MNSIFDGEKKLFFEILNSQNNPIVLYNRNSYELILVNKEAKQLFGITEDIKDGETVYDYLSKIILGNDDLESLKSLKYSGDVVNINIFIISENKEKTQYTAECKLFEKDKEEKIVCVSFSRKINNEKPDINVVADRKRAIIEGLGDDYLAIYYVENTKDIFNAKVISYRDHSFFRNELPEEFTGTDSFYSKMNYLNQNVVHPDDRDMFYEKTQKSVIDEVLRTKKSYYVEFRAIYSDGIHLYQLKFVGDYDSNGNLLGYIVGLINSDDRIKHENILNMYQEAMLKGAHSYFFVNLSENRIIPPVMVRDGERMKPDIKEFGNKTYDEVIRSLSKTLQNENAENYLNDVSSKNLIKSYLSGVTIKENNFKVYESNKGWNYRKKTCVLSRDKFSGDIIALCITYHLSAEEELDIKKAEDVDHIMKLSNNFEAIYDLEVETGKYRVYTRNNQYSEKINSKINYDGNFYEIIYDNTKKVVCPEDRDEVLAFVSYDNIVKMLAKQDSFYLDYRLMIDDENVWYRLKVIKNTTRKEKSVLIGVFNVNEEISQNIQKQNKLEEMYKSSELNLRIANALSDDYNSVFRMNFETGAFSIMRMKENQNISSVQLPKDYHNLVYAYADNFIFPEYREDFKELFRGNNLQEQLKNKKKIVYRYETKVNAAGESHFEMVLTKVDILDSSNVIAAFKCIDDVYRREKEEKEHASIFSALGRDFYNIYLVNLNTQETRIIKQKGFKYNGTGENNIYEEMCSDYIDNIVHPEDREEMKKVMDVENVKTQLQTKDEYTHIYRMLEDNEEDFHYYQIKYIKTYNLSEIIVGFQIFDDVVSAERARQDELKNALMEAEKANRSKTVFLNNMSHDIRTPMNAIIGFTSLALSHLDDENLINDYLKKIMTSSNHLLSLINDVLDMSRIESGRVTIEEKEFHLPTLLNDLRSIFQADVNAKRQNFVVDVVDVYDEDFYCDKLRINQVLLNCISNAVKYTAPGGTIGLRIIQNQDAPEGYINLTFIIKDNGIGMSEEFAKHIFEPFTREETSTVNGIQGTGLGMSITKNIVEMMGGNISVRSQKDVGTEFTINLTFRKSENSQKLEPIEKIQGVRALVVDDNMDSCISISRMLKMLGMQPEWTMSYADIDKKLEANEGTSGPVKVFVIDRQIPEYCGIPVVQNIRKKAGDDAVIIIMASYNSIDCEKDVREAGVNAVCTKPLFITDLYDILNDNLIEKIPEATVEQKKEFSERRILLVEDNDLNREIASVILKESDILIEEAENGQVAVDMFLTSDVGYYSLIFMDIQMPVMNGYDAARKIRSMSRPDAMTIPIIAMTANAFAEDVEACKEAGMNEHLAKPFNIKKMGEVLEQYLP